MMMRGVISLGDLTYFVGLTAVFLIPQHPVAGREEVLMNTQTDATSA